MIEQLQSLLKALEAGSYNHPVSPLERPKRMNLVYTIMDKETGKIVSKGLVTDMTVKIDSGTHFGMDFAFGYAEQIHAPKRTVSFNGIETSRATDTVEQEVGSAHHYFSKPTDAVKPDYFKPACAHVWKNYQGFMDNYSYCEKCNEKQ